MADSELRRRHPGIELPPLHVGAEEVASVGVVPAALDEAGALDASWIESGRESVAEPGDTVRHDIGAALEAARRAQRILAERQYQADHEAEVASDDVMRRRAADALQEAAARASAVRQEPVPSRRAASLERDEAELEAGQ